MNIVARTLKRGVVLVGVTALILSWAATGEVRSGFWTLVQPTADSVGSHVDFSVLSSFCFTEAGGQKCSLTVTDCYFRYDSIIAPKGVYYDSSISASLQSLGISGKTIQSSREALFYLDSMMKKTALKTPQSGFRNSIPARSGVFFVKTDENRTAVMIKAWQYIGDIDRTSYYWAYQPDSSDALFKTRLVGQPASLTITVDAFSGRPNPVFTLIDSAAIAVITHEAFVSVNAFLDSTVKRSDRDGCPEKLGYRSLSVYGMFESENPLSSYMPTLEICGGKITYYKIPPEMSSAPPFYFYDKGSKLEKLIIKVCCEKGLSMIDQYGTVKLCDIVPDSLKPTAPVTPGAGTGAHKGDFWCRVKSRELCFQLEPFGRARIECLSLTGKTLATLQCTGNESGAFAVDVRDFSMGPGAYIIKCRRPDSDGKSMIFPVFIYR